MSIRFVFAFVSALCAAHGVIQAATFDVASGDVYGVNGLVYAMNVSANNNQDDIINLAAGTYVLTVVNNTTLGNNGLPVIAQDNGRALTINGNGSIIQRSTGAGTPVFRIFLVACITQCANKQTTINDLVIERGGCGFRQRGRHQSRLRWEADAKQMCPARQPR